MDDSDIWTSVVTECKERSLLQKSGTVNIESYAR